MTPDQMRIRKLEEEIDVLKAEIEWLRGTDELKPEEVSLRRHLRLSRMEWNCLRLLLGRGSVSKDGLYSVLYPDADRDPKGIDVIVCKVRAKLRPHGFIIENVWGQGFSLSKASRDCLLSLLDHERRRFAA